MRAAAATTAQVVSRVSVPLKAPVTRASLEQAAAHARQAMQVSTASCSVQAAPSHHATAMVPAMPLMAHARATPTLLSASTLALTARHAM